MRVQKSEEEEFLNLFFILYVGVSDWFQYTCKYTLMQRYKHPYKVPREFCNKLFLVITSTAGYGNVLMLKLFFPLMGSCLVGLMHFASRLV